MTKPLRKNEIYLVDMQLATDYLKRYLHKK